MSRMDSLAYVESSDTDSTVKTLSIFQEEYRYARLSLGKDHTSARNHAIDYHRQHTAREATDHWDEQMHTFEDENQTSALDTVLFNDLVQRIYLGGNDEHRQFFFAIIRMNDLDQHFNEINRARCDETIGDFSPDSIKEIVARMGMPARANGSSSRAPALRRELMKLASSLWPTGRPA